MSLALITEIRALICSAMTDIGGSCERLKEIEDPDLRAAVVDEAREEIGLWLDQAAHELNKASLLAQFGEFEKSEPVAAAITKLGGKTL